MKCWHRSILAAGFLIFLAAPAWAQEVRKIQFYADSLSKYPTDPQGVFRLQSNVWMKHKNLTLTCDSAYYDEPNSHFIGYNRVHIIKADTLHIYCGQIDYNGTTELARLDGNVLMDNVRERLRAPRLDYDMKEEVAWYFGGGQIIDTTNTVESFWGYYYVKRNEFFFKENVTLTNPDNTLVTDSLRYNSKTEAMWFEGPTQVFSDTNYIYCEKGYYNSREKISTFSKKVFMQAKEQLLRSDSLLYNQAEDFSEAFGSIELRDTVENMIVTGEHLYYDETRNQFRINGNAQYIMAEEPDSLFLHSDTLFSTREDSTGSRRIQAFPQVQFYRTDIQGRCDSLDYLVSDSVIRLFRDPVIWQDKNQMTADTVSIFLSDEGIREMVLQNNGFLITEEDSACYNQIKGKSITGQFRDDQLRQVNVTGNGECLFYPKDQEDIIGLQKTVCSNILIYFAEKKIDRIAFVNNPDNKLIPLSQTTTQERFLEGYRWLGDKRPANKDDIRVWK